MLYFFRKVFSKPAKSIHSKDKDFIFPGLRRRSAPRNDGICKVPRPFVPLNDGNSSVFHHHDDVCEDPRPFAPLSDGNPSVFRHPEESYPQPRHPEERSDVGIQSSFDPEGKHEAVANLTHRRGGGGTTKLAAKKSGKKTLFKNQNRGASLMEMACAVGLIAVIALPALKYLGTELQGIFSSIDAGFEGVDGGDARPDTTTESASDGYTESNRIEGCTCDLKPAAVWYGHIKRDCPVHAYLCTSEKHEGCICDWTGVEWWLRDGCPFHNEWYTRE